MQDSSNLTIKEILLISKLAFNNSYPKGAKIINSHGPYVILDNNTKVFDLRPYHLNPIFGHKHPVFKRNYNTKNILNLKKSLIQEELNFYTRVYENKRLTEIVKKIHENFNGKYDLPIIELDQVLDEEKLIKNGLLICNDNIMETKTKLYLNISLDTENLNELLKRIKHCLL